MKRMVAALSGIAFLCFISSGCLSKSDEISQNGRTTTSSVNTSSTTTFGSEMPITSTTATDNTSITDDFTLTSEQEEELNTLISAYEGQVSVLYYDIGSEYSYTYNSNYTYFAASIIKAPFCLYVLQKAEQGETDLNETMEYTEEFYTTGTGIIKKDPYGTVYTKKTLVEYALRYSDNIAFKMLRTAYPASGFKQYARSIGIRDIEGIKNVSSSNITADDALTYMKEIYTFISSGSEYAALMEDSMLRTVNPMIRASYPVVRKYGWASGAYHDMAIVQAPRPYILIILSDHDKGTKEDNEMFRTISQAIESVCGQ